MNQNTNNQCHESQGLNPIVHEVAESSANRAQQDGTDHRGGRLLRIHKTGMNQIGDQLTIRSSEPTATFPTHRNTAFLGHQITCTTLCDGARGHSHDHPRTTISPRIMDRMVIESAIRLVEHLVATIKHAI